MTDVQLLTSIRTRAATRLSNALFVKIIDQMIVEARSEILEKPIMERFVSLCSVYLIRLDEFDRAQIAQPRPKYMSQARQKRLQAIGFGVENPS